MNTQRVEGHTPTPYKYYNNGKGRDRIEDANGDIVCEQIGHLDGPFIVHACNNIERLEKVNEALVRACEQAIQGLEEIWLDNESPLRVLQEAVRLAREPA